jgi:hypothetical protein
VASFMMLLHLDQGVRRQRQPEEFAAQMREYRAWTDEIRAAGRFRMGNKLTEDAGRIVKSADGRVTTTDGPYAESKELVGGFYVIHATDYADACQVATSCPHLKYGWRVELRQVEEL